MKSKDKTQSLEVGQVYLPDVINIRKMAFTLAEVLITLGILGVVTVMTIPSLINNYQMQQTTLGVKKFYTIMTQAIKSSEIDNGSMIDWNIPTSNVFADSQNYFETYLKPYLNVIYQNTQVNVYKEPWVNNYIKYLNGTYLSISGGQEFILVDGTDAITFCISGNMCYFYVDINGLKSPNIFGKDVFVFSLVTDKNFFGPYKLDNKYTRDRYVTDVTRGCNKDARGEFCSAVIMLDGWKISDDYPW